MAHFLPHITALPRPISIYVYIFFGGGGLHFPDTDIWKLKEHAPEWHRRISHMKFCSLYLGCKRSLSVQKGLPSPRQQNLPQPVLQKSPSRSLHCPFHLYAEGPAALETSFEGVPGCKHIADWNQNFISHRKPPNGWICVSNPIDHSQVNGRSFTIPFKTLLYSLPSFSAITQAFKCKWKTRQRQNFVLKVVSTFSWENVKIPFPLGSQRFAICSGCRKDNRLEILEKKSCL